MRKPGRVVAMRMRQHDGGWPGSAEPIHPVGSAINHDASATVLDEQRAMTSVTARMDLDFAPRAKERQPHVASPAFAASQPNARPLLKLPRGAFSLPGLESAEAR
jgi:hypothetical protein